MEQIYLVTGATGFLGQTIIRKLKKQECKIVGLLLSGDRTPLMEGVIYEQGDVTKRNTLQCFFSHAKGKEAVLIHCAGLVTVASREDRLWMVNVDGTRNIVDFCEKYSISRLVHVASVHAIPEDKQGLVQYEPSVLSASHVEGIYGKSKAEAAYYVKKAAEKGLDVRVVYPSGIIGPGDTAGGYMTETIRAYIKGYFPVAVEGGYDFVDVRDVADGVVACARKKDRGGDYILSGKYISIREIFDILSMIEDKKPVIGTLPLSIVKFAAPACETVCRLMKKPMLITPYSVYTLGSNGRFSNAKAQAELGYCPRPIEHTLADTARWIRKKEKRQ